MNHRRILGVASFSVPLLLYLVTICPTIHLGDSGELHLATTTLSISHNPGSPFFSMLGHAICRFPFGNGAFKGNLFSALSGALACFLLYRFLLWRFGRSVPAFAFAISLAGSFTLWEQSLKVRIYPLNTCFAIGAIWLTMLWRKNHDRRILFALALMFGLGLANHEILLPVAVVPAIAMLADIKKLRVVDVFAACGFGILGLSLYGYLPLRAAADPLLNWGNPQVDPVLFSKELYNLITLKGVDFTSLNSLFDVLLQRQYAQKMMTAGLEPKILMLKIDFP